MVEGLGPSPEKSFLYPKLWVHFDAVFNRQKPWNTDFPVHSRDEAYKNSTEIYIKNSRLDQGGAVAAPHEYAIAIRCFFL